MGNGYTADPIVTLGSAVSSEERVADMPETVIISLNHNEVEQLITQTKINPKQTSGSQDGKTLYTNGRIRDNVIGIVTSVTVAAGGSGYTSVPTVTFSGGGATIQATGCLLYTSDAADE